MKKILISSFLFIILSSNSFSNEIEDCSKYNKFSAQFYKCKSTNFIKETKNYQKKEWSNEKKKIDKIKKKVLN